MLLLQKGMQVAHVRALAASRNSTGGSNYSLSTIQSELQRNLSALPGQIGGNGRNSAVLAFTPDRKSALLNAASELCSVFSGGHSSSPVFTIPLGESIAGAFVRQMSTARTERRDRALTVWDSPYREPKIGYRAVASGEVMRAPRQWRGG